tara:strand:+ start:56 stop:343 length:288 start_codon:yes stop_codon:yes gene_type:complete
MNKVTKMALLGCGAFLLVNSINNTSKNNKISKKLDKMNACSNEYYTINEKLDHLTKHTVTHAWEETIQTQRETIDSLLLDQMEIGAMLDSCIISK